MFEQPIETTDAQGVIQPPQPCQPCQPPLENQYPERKAAEGILMSVTTRDIVDSDGNPTLQTIFSLDSAKGATFSAAFGAGFTRDQIPIGSRIRIVYVEKDGMRHDGTPVTWRNLVDKPLVLDGSDDEFDGGCFDEEAVCDGFDGRAYLDRAGRPQHGIGSRTDSTKLANRTVKTVERACRQLSNLMNRGRLPVAVASRIATAVSHLDGMARRAFSRGGLAW